MSTCVGEVSLSEFEFLNSQSLSQDFFGFLASDADAAGNLFESSDTEGSDGESSLGKDWLLANEIFKDFGGLGELITGFSDRDVEDELVDLDFSHWVVGLALLGGTSGGGRLSLGGFGHSCF